MMKCKILEFRPDFVRLLLENTKPAMANAYRRTIQSEVPILAIDEVIFLANTTAFFDEYIAHRLALIPLRTPRKVLDFGEDFSVRLKLDVTAEEEQTTVYSGQLESSDPEVFPVNPKIPIVVMNKGERLSLEAIARVGRGKEHVKWQPVVALGYRYYPIYIFDPKRCGEAKELVEKLNAEIVQEDGMFRVLDAPYHPELEKVLRRCAIDLGEPVVKVEYDDSTIIIKFESTGALDCDEILLLAAEELIKKLEILEDSIRDASQS
ncbi:MAG TPA: DNA-directed RNA polymerase subunit D [Candidatus Korarchaeota archaeon]|nr:DNA-directed RNA polymerase subunit D [Candidatus Korarchaeota archaeon]